MLPLNGMKMPPKRAPMEYIGEGEVYITQSTSRPSIHHVTFKRLDSGHVTCTCEGFRNHRHCWHADEIADEEEDFQVSL